jgi:glycosyltransferase involved in cell wall biosynthesis
MAKAPLLYIATEDQAFLAHRLPMARAARDAGFDVHVGTHVVNGAARIEAEGFSIHALPFRRGGAMSPIAATTLILALRRLYNTLQPVIIHHSGLQASVLGSLAATGIRSQRVNALTGLGYTFTSQNASTLRAIIAPVLRYLLNAKRSTPLVQNPDDSAALVAMGIDPKRIALIRGSGVDVDALRPLPEPEGPITVGFAGRLLADKGIRALIEAHRLLRLERSDIRLLIAGEPDPANPASVTREEAEGWAREPGITWLGQVSQIHTLWERSHIAALPSHREGLPKSLLEAAAFGRPLVATDAPGCREIAIPDVTGFRVPVENAAALAAAIGRLADDAGLRVRFGAAARRLVEQEFSSSLVGQRIVALYRSLLPSGG